MYKTEVIKKVAKETRLSQRVVGDVLAASHAVIQDALQQGQSVQFPSFGTFYTRQRPAGQVRHVTTGKPLNVPATRIVGFRVGAVLKRQVRKVALAGQPRKRRGLRTLLSR